MLLLFDSVLSSGNTLLEILQICYGHKSGNNRLVNATNIRTFEARNNYKMEIHKTPQQYTADKHILKY